MKITHTVGGGGGGGNPFYSLLNVYCTDGGVSNAGTGSGTNRAGHNAAPSLEAGNRQLTVSWAAPDDGGSTITAYNLQRSTDGGNSWSGTITVDAPATSSTITELKDGTTYIVRVRAVNAVGMGIWSQPSADATTVDVPMAPTTLVLTVGDGHLTATWIAPTDTGGSLFFGMKHGIA